jgi:hypothetical protein
MHRRNFLGSLFAIATALRSPRAWAELPLPAAHSFGREQLREQVLENLGELSVFRLLYLTAGNDHSQLVILNTRGMRVEKVIEVGIEKRHSIALSPGADPRYALLAELDGAKASLVDLKKGEELLVVSASDPNHVFSGHALFSRDGSTVYLPEFPQEPGASHGRVVARSVPSMAVVKSFDSGFYRPHEILLSHDGHKLLVGHKGRSLSPHEPTSDGGLSVLQLPEGKPLPFATPENPYLALAHLDRDEHDNLFVAPLSSSGSDLELMSPVLFGHVGAATWESRLPPSLKERFRGNSSVRLARKAGILGVTHANGRMATFWDAKARKYLGLVDFGPYQPISLEVTPDERYFLVNTTSDALFFIDVKTLKVTKRTGLIGIGLCPHICAMPIAT